MKLKHGIVSWLYVSCTIWEGGQHPDDFVIGEHWYSDCTEREFYEGQWQEQRQYIVRKARKSFPKKKTFICFFVFKFTKKDFQL